jgi:hypothetical protein
LWWKMPHRHPRCIRYVFRGHMDPEDSCLWVYGVVASTRDGIDNLRQIVGDKKAAGHRPTNSPNHPQRVC